MKINLKIEKEFDVKYLEVSAQVRYWEDSKVDGVPDTDGTLIPCQDGDMWVPLIDIETGKIVNWKEGVEADIHYKVADAGEYWLLDENRDRIVKSKGCYVPDILAIEDNGFGDYIILKIDKNGIINNWKFDVSAFTGEED